VQPAYIEPLKVSWRKRRLEIPVLDILYPSRQNSGTITLWNRTPAKTNLPKIRPFHRVVYGSRKCIMLNREMCQKGLLLWCCRSVRTWEVVGCTFTFFVFTVLLSFKY